MLLRRKTIRYDFGNRVETGENCCEGASVHGFYRLNTVGVRGGSLGPFTAKPDSVNAISAMEKRSLPYEKLIMTSHFT